MTRDIAPAVLAALARDFDESDLSQLDKFHFCTYASPYRSMHHPSHLPIMDILKAMQRMNPEVPEVLKRALLRAVEIIAEMDKQLWLGCEPVAVVPDAILSAVQTSPIFADAFADKGYRELLLFLISEYGLLRRTTWEHVYTRPYPPPVAAADLSLIFYVTTDDLLDVMDESDWKSCHPDFYHAFSAILPEAGELVDAAVSTIEW